MNSTETNIVELLVAWLSARTVEWGARATLALAAVVLGLVLTRLAQRWVAGFLRRAQPAQEAVLGLALSRVVLLTGLTLTIALALAFLGVNIGALVAGLGLTSVALGFALKDTIEQAITGMLLLFQQPFHVGDLVEIDGVEGHVSEVGIRTTALRTLDGVHVLIPNNRVYQTIIRNKSKYPARRFTLALTLPDEVELATAQRLLASSAAASSTVCTDPAPFVTLEGISDSGVRATIRYWVPSEASPLTAQTELTAALVEAWHAAGLELSPATVVRLAERGGAAEADEVELTAAAASGVAVAKRPTEQGGAAVPVRASDASAGRPPATG